MRTTAVFASAGLLAAASVSALPEIAVSKRDRHTNGRTSNVARGVVERQDDGDAIVGTNVFDVGTWSTGGAYYANITAGTPPQNQVVILDTGSSDLYFDASTASECSLPDDNPNSCQGGTFDHGASDTYSVADPSPAFNTSFGDGSTASGPFGRDVVCVGDVCITNVQFGVAEEVDSTTGFAIGLMGIGYSLNEAVEQHLYPNIPEVLVDADVINSRLYSVYLNEVDDVSGSILFGGIDTSRYTGDMVTLDILPDYNLLREGYHALVYQFVQVVTGVTANVDGDNQVLFSGGTTGVDAYTAGDSLPVLLDTGSAAWSVPQEVYSTYFAPAFPYVDRNGFCSCSHASSDDSLDIEFGGAITIKVPASEFIVPIYNTTTQETIPYPGTNDDACAFMITPSPSLGTGFQTLGDSILRSMYVVFDLDQGQLSIAQANTANGQSPNVQEVPAGPGGVASAVSIASQPQGTGYRVAPPVNATVSFSASTIASTIGTATGTAAVPADARPDSSGSSSSDDSSTSSSGVAAGIVVPGFDWAQVWVSGLAVLGVGAGMGMML